MVMWRVGSIMRLLIFEGGGIIEMLFKRVIRS